VSAPVEHPLWCDRYNDSPGGIGPRELDLEHQSRDLRLDAGETFAWSISASLVQPYEDEVSAARLRLDIEMHELEGSAQALLSAGEVRRLMEMLKHHRHALETWSLR